MFREFLHAGGYKKEAGFFSKIAVPYKACALAFKAIQILLLEVPLSGGPKVLAQQTSVWYRQAIPLRIPQTYP